MKTLFEMVTGIQIKALLTGAVGFMLLIMVCLFITLVMHKIYVEYRVRRYNRLKGRYMSLMTEKMYDPAVTIAKPVKNYEYEVLGDVIAEMLVNFSGEIVERLKAEARDLGLVVHYRKMTSSRSWVRRFVAVEKLGLLRLPELRPLYLNILENEKDLHIIAKTVWALSLIAWEGIPAAINGVLKNPSIMSSKYTEFIYTNIIAAFRESGTEESFIRLLALIKDDPELPLILKRDIIAACGVAEFYPAKELIVDYFHCFHDSPEMRIACVRALERLSALDASRIIEECLRDEDWRVRAAAAKNAYVCSDELLGPLKEALHDSNYYVRINAALSLAKFGAHGMEALSEATRDDDRFARDVSRYVLKR